MSYNKYLIKSTGCLIQLRHIQDREAGKKLDKPIYFFEYLNRTNKPDIRCYLENVERNLWLENWIEHDG